MLVAIGVFLCYWLLNNHGRRSGERFGFLLDRKLVLIHIFLVSIAGSSELFLVMVYGSRIALEQVAGPNGCPGKLFRSAPPIWSLSFYVILILVLSVWVGEHQQIRETSPTSCGIPCLECVGSGAGCLE